MLFGIVLCRQLRVQGNGDFLVGVVVQTGKGFLAAGELIAVGVQEFAVYAVFFTLFSVLQLLQLQIVFFVVAFQGCLDYPAQV